MVGKIGNSAGDQMIRVALLAGGSFFFFSLYGFLSVWPLPSSTFYLTPRNKDLASSKIEQGPIQ